MFERVILSPETISLGSLAEAIVYYGKVDVVYQNGHLVELIRQIGIADTIRLAESELVTFLYDFQSTGLSSSEMPLPYSFYSLTIIKSARGRPIRNAADEIVETLQRSFAPGTLRVRDVRRLIDAIEVRDDWPKSVTDSVMADISDENFLTAAIQAALKVQIPDYPGIGLIRATGISDGKTFSVDTNIDFRLANSLYANHVAPEQLPLTLPHLIAPIFGMRSEMYYSGGRDSDIWTDNTKSALLKVKVNSFIGRLEGNINRIDRFEDHIFEGRSFGDAVTSGFRSIGDVLDFAEMEETQKFKSWIKSGPKNADLLSEYEKSKVAPSYLASALPIKLSRLVFLTAVGGVIENRLGGSGAIGAFGGLATDFVLNTADDQLFSHLKIGWRPNQWVSQVARPFLQTDKIT